MIGPNATVTIEHLGQTRDAHGAKVDGAPVTTETGVEANVSRASLGNLWRIMLDGNRTAMGEKPSEYRITDEHGRVFTPVKVSYRPPVGRFITESEHTLVFAEQFGEINTEVRV